MPGALLDFSPVIAERELEFGSANFDSQVMHSAYSSGWKPAGKLSLSLSGGRPPL